MKKYKKDKVSYYIGWGIAYGTFAGGILGSLTPDSLTLCFFMGIAIGAAIGGIYGRLV